MFFRKLLGVVALSNCVIANGMDLSAIEQTELSRGAQGNLFHFPELARGRQQLPVIPVTTTKLPGPQLLFSDLPEYIGPTNGITLMENLTPGNYRLYIYHVPGSKGVPRTVSAVVQNLGRKTLQVQFGHYAFPKPGTDYAAMGVAALMDFFTGPTRPPPLSVEPGGKAVLDPALEETAAQDPQLVHALYELRIDQPVRLAVLQRDTNQSSLKVFDTLARLPRQLPGKETSGAGRGIFPWSEIAVGNAENSVIDSAAGVQRLVLADGHRDAWVQGTDGLSGNMAVTNKGSYGVVYHIHLALQSSDGRGMALLVGAPGRRESRPKATLKVSDGIWKGGWLKIAAERAASRPRGTMALMQKFVNIAKGKTNYVDIIYSPPGGSSLPTPIFFVPFRP